MTHDRPFLEKLWVLFNPPIVASLPREPGSKDWAYRLVAEFEAGRPTKPISVYRTAYAAIGRRFPERQKPDKTLPPEKITQPVARPVPVPKTPPTPWFGDNEREQDE